MTRLVLDTSAYSNFRRGDPAVVSLVSTASWIGMTAIVLGELRAGFGLGKRRTRNEHELTEFLSHPVVRTLDVDDEAEGREAEQCVEAEVPLDAEPAGAY